jgi:acetyl-CoA C-acetyltransferase
MKRVFIAAYHQSKFGKLFAMTVPQIIAAAVTETCAEIGAEPEAIDVGSVGATCNFSLNEQGLLAGLVAMVPGLGAKPIEAVENACASGGQAVLSVAQKLQLGLGEVGIALGFEKMRDAEGKMDGALIGKVLGYFSHPDEREGKVYVFPHLFAEVMRDYMATHGVTERDFARSRRREYANANHNPYAQMQKVQVTLERRRRSGPQPLHRRRAAAEDLRLLADHRRLRGADPRHRGGPRAARRGQGRLRRDRRLRPGHRSAAEGGARRPPAGRRLRGHERGLRDGGREPRRRQRAEIHDCFTVMGAIGTEVIGKAAYGRAPATGPRARPTRRRVRHQHLRRPDRQGAPGRRHRRRHDRLVAPGSSGQGAGELQVKTPKLAATFNIGGPICASVCTVLKRTVSKVLNSEFEFLIAHPTFPRMQRPDGRV